MKEKINTWLIEVLRVLIKSIIACVIIYKLYPFGAPLFMYTITAIIIGTLCGFIEVYIEDIIRK